jgi:translation initiation factor 4A
MELAQQIEIVFTNIGKYLDLRVGQAVKSIPVRENVDQLSGVSNNGLLPHVIIGTPGRLLDMLNKKVIDRNTIKMLILDEADELLSDGFLQQTKNIINSLKQDTQIGLFSATMDPNFFKITQYFMRNPINVLIKKEELTLEGIKQFYIDCEKNDYKFETLCDLYSLISVSQTIIYCNHYQSVEQLTKKLQDQNFKVSCIHGNMDITLREEAMRNFRNMSSRVLISTDLLGRGIDVQQVSVVINYDIPLKIESYIHRIGRSGRHGRKGTAINFVNGTDYKRLTEIEKYYLTHIEPLPGDIEQILGSNQ